MSDTPQFQHFPSPEEQAPYEEGYPLPVAPKAGELPPGAGAQVLPHFVTFSQIVNYASRVYRYTHDEALRDNWNNALAIRRDPVIMDALRSRQLPTAQLPWHLECEDDQDEWQALAVEALTDIVNRIPRFQMLKMHLLEALWFGRYGVQCAYSWQFKKGQKFLSLRDFRPINGDKLVFRFSGQSGILVHQMYKGTWEVTDRGRAHFFSAEERDQLIIHRHEPEDADFFEPELGGSLQGVGIRGRLYWLWYLRSQVTAFLMDYLERVGAGGFTIYYYEAGSQSSANEVTNAVQTQYRNNAVLFPRYRDGTTGGPGIERIEPSMAGAALMQSLVTEYFDAVMRRYILGQNLTTEAGATGLGSGLADLHGETFARYVKYDAVNLGDTLSTDLIAVLQKNSPYCDVPPLRFVFDVDKPNANETLQAAQVFFDMGGSIDEDQLRSVIGLEKPQPGHAMLAKMGAMSPASAGSVPAGVPMLGQPGPDMGQGGEQMPPEAMGQMPPQAGPMPMSRRGRRLRFARSDFHAAVKQHFPTAKGGEESSTLSDPEAQAHEYVVDLPDRQVFLNYGKDDNAVDLDFRFRDTPQNQGEAKGVWQPRSELGAGSVDFVRNLKRFLGVMAQRGLSLRYSADPHHHDVYSRLLRRWGWTKAKQLPGFWGSNTNQVWLPPQQKVQMSRPVKFASKKTLQAHPGVLEHANSYLRKIGLPEHAAESPYLPVDENRSKRIAELYEELKHSPRDPRVRAAYKAFKQEIVHQYNHLRRLGVNFEPYLAEGQPYANSQEMAEDARKGHLYFFTGGDFPKDHILGQPSGVKHKGRDLSYNDLFRAVHDYYGHAMYGNQFGPRGEEHAYRTHARMFSPEARPAMAMETRGQNSWVNYGTHLRNAEGRIPQAGEPGHLPAAQRPYAEQKNALLPDDLLGD